jgi:hypothetical protein
MAGWEVCSCAGVEPSGGKCRLGWAERCADVQVLSLVAERAGQAGSEVCRCAGVEPCGREDELG